MKDRKKHSFHFLFETPKMVQYPEGVKKEEKGEQKK